MDPLRTALAECARRAYTEKLFSGTSGNLSVRTEDGMFITPTSVRYESLRPEDIVHLRLDGTVLDGSLAPSSEWRMHAEIYRRFPEIGAVVHTHSPCATAFAAANKPIPACLIEMRYFLGGTVPCADYAEPGTEEVGIRCAEVLPGRGGCLMANHGALAVGADLSQALLRAEYIEDAAKISLLSMQIGGPVLLPDEEETTR